MRANVVAGEIAKLELREGDTLVFKTKKILERTQVDAMLEYLKPLAPPTVKFIILDGSFELQVVRAALLPA